MILQPFDCLLYGPSSMWGYLIALKTWRKVAHVEVYKGDAQSWASRDGKGVSLYPVRQAQLQYVLRPKTPVGDVGPWFQTVNGQPYDWAGLMRFLYWGSIGTGNNGRMFCSEFACRLYRAGGLDPFNQQDADAIAPGDFLLSNCFTEVTRVSKDSDVAVA